MRTLVLILILALAAPAAEANPCLDTLKAFLIRHGLRKPDLNPDEVETIKDLNASLFSFPEKNKAVTVARNDKLLKELKTPIPARGTGRAAAISRAEADEMYEAIDHHPVADQCVLERYDPTGNMGFCFGRATAVHLEALYRGVEKDKIRKIWVVGDLRTGFTKWRYHVATMVQAKEGGWWVIDPFQGRVMSEDEWYRAMKHYDHNGKLQLFVTEPERFGPDAPTHYTRAQLADPGYHSYFKDLLKSFREEAPFSGPRLKPQDVK